MNAEPQIIVITPVKNEDWILHDFLRVTSYFADHIIIGDHFSTDNSMEIARTYPKVSVFRSHERGFSERERRNELLREARKLGANNVILSLDADEFLSPSFLTKENLQTLRSLEIGTRIRLPFFNLRPDLNHYWTVPQDPIGFLDDGSVHQHSKMIHFPRIPDVGDGRIFELEGSGIVHLQYIDWARMESKHRWYRAWERANFPRKTSLDIQRRYSHMHGVPSSKLQRLPEDVLRFYEKLGVDFKALQAQKDEYWWDAEVEKLIEANGKSAFEFIDLEPLLEKTGGSLKSTAYWRYLEFTTLLYGSGKFSPLRLLVRALDEIVKHLWV